VHDLETAYLYIIFTIIKIYFLPFDYLSLSSKKENFSTGNFINEHMGNIYFTHSSLCIVFKMIVPGKYNGPFLYTWVTY
jgi:hypothetical protein